MGRTLRLAALLVACAALAPACFIEAGPFEGDGTGATGGTGGTGATGGEGGTGNTATTTSTPGNGGTGGVSSSCPNSVVEAGEECDDGNVTLKDGCASNCTVEPGWTCTGSPSTCSQTCGDGTLETAVGEACDDGNTNPADGCSATCQIEDGYECEGTMPSVCVAICGNGEVDPGETCDDANTVDDDGCTGCSRDMGWTCLGTPSVCAPICGDGLIVGPELCDDEDEDGSAGCNEDCTAEVEGWDCSQTTGGANSCAPICGDALAVGDEPCDDGNQTAGDGCSNTCVPEHTCDNGIVEPTEQCDGNFPNAPQCEGDCTLTTGSVCANAIEIPLGTVNELGVRTSFYQHNNSDQVKVPNNEVPSPPCWNSTNTPVIHRYKTGNRPSVLTVESLDKMMDNSMTFNKTVVWVYRDCPMKADIEACDNNGASDGQHSKLTTGYLPAQTTVFIVLAGEGGPDKGKYRISVIEDPVRLFYFQSFGPETMGGNYPLPAELTAEVMGDGGWIKCVDAPGALCLGASPPSHSRGAFAWARGMTATQTTATLKTPTFDFTPYKDVQASYSWRLTDGTGAEESGDVKPIDAGNTSPGAVSLTPGTFGRGIVPLVSGPMSRVDLIYGDGASAAAGTLGIDDIYIYGH